MSEQKIPSILEQYITHLSFDKLVDIDINTKNPPKVNVSGNYEASELDSDISKVIIDLKVLINYEEKEAFLLKLQYVAFVEINDVEVRELNIFLYLELPPMLFMELREIVANLTEKAGIHKILIDPWDLSRQFANGIGEMDA